MDIVCNVGGRETRWASLEDARDLVVGLGQAVAAAQKALVEARVMLGHVLRALRGACSLQAWEDFVRSTGLHRRRVTEAMSIAEEFATQAGAVNWEAYRARCASDAKPSVRAMVAAIATRRAAERAKVTPRPTPAAVAELEADAVAEAAAAMADLELEAALQDAQESIEAVEAAGVAGVAAVVVEEVAAAAPVEVAGAAGQVGAVGSRGASGKQLSMGPLFEEAWQALERVRSVFARIGVDGVGEALGLLSARLRAAA